MSSKAPVSAFLGDFLRYEAGRPEAAADFAPVADWTKADQYPPLKLLDQYSREDYLRLAWEFLRRMPRYRRQHRKLKEMGINKPTFYPSQSGSFFTSESPPDAERWSAWENLNLRGHACQPPIDRPEQTFGDYVDEREKAVEPWFVMNRRRWVMDLWGLRSLPSPTMAFDRLGTGAIFSAPAAAVSVVSKGAPADRPQLVNTYVRQNEIILRLRLDTPLEQQLDAVRLEFARAQQNAGGRRNSALDPLAAIGRRKAGKEVLPNDDLASQRSIRAEASEGRVLLKQLELSPFWLRTWDAFAEARIQQETAKPRLDRNDIIRQFEKDSQSLLSGGAVGPVTSGDARSMRRRQGQSLADMLFKALTPAMVPNWRDRSEKYIEKSDDAFRQLVALAFGVKAD